MAKTWWRPLNPTMAVAARKRLRPTRPPLCFRKAFEPLVKSKEVLRGKLRTRERFFRTVGWTANRDTSHVLSEEKACGWASGMKRGAG